MILIVISLILTSICTLCLCMVIQSFRVDGETDLGIVTKTVVIAATIGWLGFLFWSVKTYPDLEKTVTYIDEGTVTNIEFSIRGRTTQIRLITDKSTQPILSGSSYQYVKIGSRIGTKVVTEGGVRTYFKCVDGNCYSHGVCQWNMSCWDEE